MVTPPVMPASHNLLSAASSCITPDKSNKCGTQNIPGPSNSPSVPIVCSSVVQPAERQTPSTSRQQVKSCPVMRPAPVNTYVFLDLETSGLYNPRIRITEFAMLAVSRTDLEAMKDITAIKSPACGRIAQVSDSNTHKNMSSSEVTTSKVKRRLFDDQFNEESVVGTYHPHFVNKRLKSLKPSTQTSEAYLNDSITNNMGACKIDPKCENGIKDEQSSEDEIKEHDKSENNLASGSEQLSNSTIQHDTPETPGTKQTCDFAGQTLKRSTSHFHALPKLPRVIEKLSKVFNPRSLISPTTEEISGLNNIVLENSTPFDSTFCNSFLNFLNSLPKPICLVGHNAMQFDFPIMLAEFYSATNCQFQCPDVFCADSLTILKVLDKIEVSDEINMVKNDIAKNLDWFLSDEIFKNLNLDESLTGSDDSMVSDSENNLNSNGIARKSMESNSPGNSFSFIKSTPVKKSGNSCRTSTVPGTPVTPSSHMPRGNATSGQPKTVHHSLPCTPNLDLLSASRIQNKCPPTPTKLPPKMRKVEPNLIFPPNSSFESKVLLASGDKEYNVGFRPSQKAFSQPVMYERLFGERYEAHRAEKDCEALLRIVGLYGPQFASAADVLKVPLSTIKPAWFTTKMKRSEHFQEAWL